MDSFLKPIVNYCFAIVLGFCALALFSNCGSQLQQTQPNMSLTPKTFENITLNTSERNACSPAKKLPGWKGIEIACPTNADFVGKTEEVFMPICGYYKLSALKINRLGPLVIHVSNVDTGKNYEGVAVIVDESPVEPIPGVEVEQEATADPNQMLGSCFNYDALEFVRFPFVTGTYKVWVEYGGEKSNEQQVAMKFQ